MSVVMDCLSGGGDERGSGSALLVEGRAALSFGQLRSLLAARAADLRSLGVRGDSRVAVLSLPGAGTASLTLTMMQSAQCLPLNPDLTAGEYEALLARAQVTHVVVPHAQGKKLREAVARRALPLLEVNFEEATAGGFHFSEPTGGSERLSEDDRISGTVVSGDDSVCLILATSGSTAEPKLVPLTHRNLRASVDNLVASLQLTKKDRCVHSMPLFHIGAIVDLLLAPLSVGGSVTMAPQMSAGAVWRDLKRGEVTWFQGVPTMLGELLLSAKRDGGSASPSLRFIRAVSSKLPQALGRDIETTLGVPVIEIYGMTETAGVITSNLLPPGERKAGSVGRAIGCDVRILNSATGLCPTREEGDVEVRGESVMAGYEGLDAQGLTDGWLHTGDRGYLDEEGYLFLTGRSKEIINRGGEKIAPLEVDEVAAQFLGNAAVASFPLPHPTLGEEVALAVARPSGTVVDEVGLRRHFAERLAPHKIPRRVFYLQELPKTASGKVMRRALAEAVVEHPAGGALSAIPETPSGSTLAMIQLWEDILDQRGLCAEDNFFDCGGDSLKVAGLVTRLKDEFQIEVAGFNIMDHPTPVALVKFIESTDKSALLIPQAETKLERPLYCDVYNVIASWFGEVPHPSSLLRGLNTLGTKVPLFWCGQEAEEQLYLAAHLGADQPLYGMRSLHLMNSRTDGSLEALGEHYAAEIRRIQPEGPYFVGGACLGGKVAFHIAEQLLAQGQVVEQLFLHEHIEPAPYAGKVCISYTKASRYSPIHQYIDAPRGWLRYYTGPIDTLDLGCRHGKYFAMPQFKLLAQRIARHLAGQEVPVAEFPRPYQGAPHSAADCRVEISFRAPSVVMSEKEFSLEVTVTNTSPRTFHPTEESGLFLASRWVLKSGEHKVFLDGTCLLEQSILPGETVRLALRCRAPTRLGGIFLEVDLVDDGIRWFHKRTESPISRQAVRVVPSPAQFFSKLTQS